MLWLDNWYRKRFSCDPERTDMSLNVSAIALLHIPSIPVFPGYPALWDIVTSITSIASSASAAAARLHRGLNVILDDDIRPAWIRVPLDIQRMGMRSVQWLPYVLTEESVSSQLDLLNILQGLKAVQDQTRRVVPLLVDMDIHYRILKLIYGSANKEFNFRMKMLLTPVLYGVCHGNILV